MMDESPTAPQSRSVPSALSAPTWQPRNEAERVLYHCHCALPIDLEVEFMSAVRNLASISPISRWSLCSGTGLSTHVMSALTTVWSVLYNLKCEFVCTLYAEKDARKRDMLDSQHLVDFMSDNIKHLRGETACLM